MLLRGILVTTALAFSIGAHAQKKVIPLGSIDAKTISLIFYPPDPLASPTGTSAIICRKEGAGSLDSVLTRALSNAGIASFQLNGPGETPSKEALTLAIDHLHKNTKVYEIAADKIGFLLYGKAASLAAGHLEGSFIGMLNPGMMPGKSFSTKAPLFIDADNNGEATIMKFYSRWLKDGKEAELHLRQQSLNDSLQASELLNWMGKLGVLKPLSSEKTVAQKKKEDWVNFLKSIDDRLHNDWAWIKRYEEDNARVPAPAVGERRVVFMGNSITEGWMTGDPDFFKGHGYVNRGIGGQTSPQMLVRFREDVVNLHPKAVVILAGINDIAENTGPSKIENVAGNIISMAEIARANGIRVILCSVLPAIAFPWHQGIQPAASVNKLNSLLKNYADENKLAYVDYYSALVDDKRGFKKELAIDGVHPNLSGYKIMEPLVEAAIAKTLLHP